MAEFTTRPAPNGAVVVHPKGRLNAAVAPMFKQQLTRLVQADTARLVIDLTDVDTIDSSIVGTFLAALRAARKAGGDLRIVSPSLQVSEVLRMTNLEQVLPAYASVDTAFQA